MTSSSINLDLQKLRVHNYRFPLHDASLTNQILSTDSYGNLIFSTDIDPSGGVGGAGSGTDGHLARWDGTSNAQDSTAIVDLSGNLTGINTLNASGDVIITGNDYPIIGFSGQVLQADGSGNLVFVSVPDLIIGGSGVANHILRWSVSGGFSGVKVSPVILNTSYSLSDIGTLNISGAATFGVNTFPINTDPPIAGKVVQTNGAGTLNYVDITTYLDSTPTTFMTRYADTSQVLYSGSDTPILFSTISLNYGSTISYESLTGIFGLSSGRYFINWEIPIEQLGTVTDGTYHLSYLIDLSNNGRKLGQQVEYVKSPTYTYVSLNGFTIINTSGSDIYFQIRWYHNTGQSHRTKVTSSEAPEIQIRELI